MQYPTYDVITQSISLGRGSYTALGRNLSPAMYPPPPPLVDETLQQVCLCGYCGNGCLFMPIFV